MTWVDLQSLMLNIAGGLRIVLMVLLAFILGDYYREYKEHHDRRVKYITWLFIAQVILQVIL